MAKTITIDGKKLKMLMKDKKINMSKASRDCGMTDSYISNSCSYNYISKAVAQLLEIKYGVMLDDYKHVEPEPVKPAEQPVEAAPVAAIHQIGMTEDDWNRIAVMINETAIHQSGMTEDDWNRIAGMINATAVDYEQLTKVIISAVVEATSMILAAEPSTRKIQQMLYAAIKGALAKIASERK